MTMHMTLTNADKCPRCGSGTKVSDSRSNPPAPRRRTRVCLACNKHYFTLEVHELEVKPLAPTVD